MTVSHLHSNNHCFAGIQAAHQHGRVGTMTFQYIQTVALLFPGSVQGYGNLALQAHTANVHSWQLVSHRLYQTSSMHACGVPAQL